MINFGVNTVSVFATYMCDVLYISHNTSAVYVCFSLFLTSFGNDSGANWSDNKRHATVQKYVKCDKRTIFIF